MAERVSIVHYMHPDSTTLQDDDAYSRSLLDKGLSNGKPLSSILGYQRPAANGHSAKIVVAPRVSKPTINSWLLTANMNLAFKPSHQISNIRFLVPSSHCFNKTVTVNMLPSDIPNNDTTLLKRKYWIPYCRSRHLDRLHVKMAVSYPFV